MRQSETIFIFSVLMAITEPLEVDTNVSKLHGITSGMSSLYVGNKNSLYKHRSGNAYFRS
jgi:putative flippase GtrA